MAVDPTETTYSLLEVKRVNNCSIPEKEFNCVGTTDLTERSKCALHHEKLFCDCIINNWYYQHSTFT